MKKKLLYKILLIIILIIAVFMLYKLISSYAVFYSEAIGTLEVNQATWRIEVNGDNIATGEDIAEFIVDNIEYTSTDKVLEGNIAPGASALFNIVIDPSDTDVAIRYDITIDETEISDENVVVSSVEETNGVTLIRTGEYTYTGTMSLAEVQSNTTVDVQVNIVWENNEENNEQDTIIGTAANPIIEIPTIVRVSQYLGETIVEYSE